uniref:non-specific serine/threonine protein kinase n=1 Tax=Leersia perrieri TaxID=77586 RepID=A0A0D9VTQ8_9ORYZ
MAEDDCDEEVELYLVALEVEEKHPTVVFCLSNPLQQCKSAIRYRTLFGPILEARKQNSVQLIFLRADQLFEAVELELTTGENQGLCNVEMIIDPSKEKAILTAYDTTEGSLLWKSTNVYSLVSALDSEVNYSFTQAAGHSDANKNLNLRLHIHSCLLSLAIEFRRDFATNGLLGKGTYGTVYKCSRGAQQLAIKRKVSSVGNHCSEIQSMVKLCGTRHVVQIYSAWNQSSSLVFIALELFERNLEEYLAARTGVDLQMSTRIFTEIMVAVKSIHEAGIIHRDLKPINILLDSNNHISVADFGNAKIKPYATAEIAYPGNSTYGTQFYCDPLLNSPHHHHNEKVDIYSCGETARSCRGIGRTNCWELLRYWKQVKKVSARGKVKLI